MKLFHLSDLHLGKRVCGQSLTEDQKHILKKITELAERERPDAVMIAGDVYDRSIPSEEAVALFDSFLFGLSELGIKVMIISGNHDSAERLAFAGRILNRSGIYISPEFNKNNYRQILKPVVMNDKYGEIAFYLLPFITPSAVRSARDDTEVSGYTEAMRMVIDDMAADVSRRNILIAHQFITGASHCDSETVSAGGMDNIDCDVFEPFDYVALGHLHGPQSAGKSTVRYCGTPMKYSFSEAGHKKSITVVNAREKGNIHISQIPLDEPLRDWHEVRGSFDDVIKNKFGDDFVKVILTDEDITNAMSRLSAYFPNILQMGYDNSRTRGAYEPAERPDGKRLSPQDMFAEFFKQQHGTEMDGKKTEIVGKIFEEIRRTGQ